MIESEENSNLTEIEFTGERVIPDKTPVHLYKEHVDRYVFASKFIRNKNVLDVACGSGYGSDYLKSNGAKSVAGLDISFEAINYARECYRKEHLDFIRGNATELPFEDDFFNVIVSFETIEHISEYEKFLKECGRVLKKDGIFICSTPNKKVFGTKDNRPSNPYHVKEFYPDEYCALVSKIFSDVELYGQAKVNLLSSKYLIKLGSMKSGLLNNNPARKIFNDRPNGLIKKGNSNNDKPSDNTSDPDEAVDVVIFKNNFIYSYKYLIILAQNKK